MDAEMKFAWCPPGVFLMGGNGVNDNPQHRVTLSKGFWMGVYPVTQAQWQMAMGNNPSHLKGDGNLPVDWVSWDDCVAFCEALGKKDGKTYRLPTEAEWEYACRAGTTTLFHFGATISPDQANYLTGPVKFFTGRTTPVGKFPANAWGLHDMHGNVWEWCADWFGPYQTGDIADPQGAITGVARMLRGGSWISPPGNCRAARRYWNVPDYRGNNADDCCGCRVALCLD